MEMTTRMIMLQNIEKMVKEQDRVDEEDSYIKQDNEDLKYLEGRYEQLQLPHTVKRVIDDYIACMQTRDTINLLKGLGMLKDTVAATTGIL